MEVRGTRELRERQRKKKCCLGNQERLVRDLGRNRRVVTEADEEDV